MNLEFLPEADEEFREAARYYESEAPGVGIALVAEVRKSVRWIIENPNATKTVGSGIRNKILNHFPYNILYSVMKQFKFTPGWDTDRVNKVLAHYESQSEEEAVAEDEAAFETIGQTVIEVPTEIVPTLREFAACSCKPPHGQMRRLEEFFGRG